MKGEEERLTRTTKAGKKKGHAWESQQRKGRGGGIIQVEGQERHKGEGKTEEIKRQTVI